MPKIRLVDGNSVGRAAHAATKLKSGEQQTQAIFNFLKSSRRWLMETPEFTPIVLWDGNENWRYYIYPGYKSKRNSTPEKIKESEEYKQQAVIIRSFMQCLGIRQAVAPKAEADDVAGILVNKFMSVKGSEIILTSGDMDWVQLVREGVTWEDHRDRLKRINIQNIFSKTGYKTPYTFLEGKCLRGDNGDCIKGVGIGKDHAPEFIAEHGSVKNFWRAVESGQFVPKLAKHKKLATPEGKAAFARNLQLMQLIKPAPHKVEIIEGNFDEEAFKELCGQYAFMSILKEIDTFLIPFKRISK